MKHTSMSKSIDIENYEEDELFREIRDEDFEELIAESKRVAEMLSEVTDEEWKEAVKHFWDIDD